MAVLICAGVLGAAAQSAYAASATWNASPTSGNFNVANWSSGGNSSYTVLSNDSLIFAASSITTLNNDLTGATYNGITFNSGASAFTIGVTALRSLLATTLS